jgi:hypothetical protein
MSKDHHLWLLRYTLIGNTTPNPHLDLHDKHKDNPNVTIPDKLLAAAYK